MFRWSLILSILSVPAGADEFTTAQLTGTMIDSTGMPVSGATVRFNSASGAKVDWTKPFQTTTDKEGKSQHPTAR